MPTMKLAAIVATLLFLPFTLHAEWTRFRGPNGTGVAEGKVPVKWSGTEHMAWKATLPGPGSTCSRLPDHAAGLSPFGR